MPRPCQLQYHVIKNRLLNVALKERSEALMTFATGPTAYIVLVEIILLVPAKVVAKFIKMKSCWKVILSGMK